MNTITALLAADLNDHTDTEQVLTTADALTTAQLLELAKARGARTGLELVLIDRLDALHAVLEGAPLAA